MRTAKRFLPEFYTEGIRNGNRMILSKAITLIESTLEEDYHLAQQVIAGCLPYTGNSFRIGITGVPGAGKSTFIEAFGTLLAEENHKIAVLAIDPTSGVSGGSILGDKTRMQELSMHPNVFIRPSPAGGSLGGVARKTRESLLLCEAAGYEIVFVETVGVGQSETTVNGMTDFFLLLMLPNAGDELQGIKKGIMEYADLILINKSDGELLPKARMAKTMYSQALRLFNPSESGWTPKVTLCSSLEKTGLKEVWEMLSSYQALTKENGYREINRNEQLLRWMEENIHEKLNDAFYHHPDIAEKIRDFKQKVIQREISPLKASDELIRYFLSGR
ncbi:MAG: methylmalonyl Co-A mutase-associated GTPase MeaB [Bacteroidia bacterium]|nr:methylmalonyl Co-A mutase-associated GTPase MeaB [Bacteroidia bacterium]